MNKRMSATPMTIELENATFSSLYRAMSWMSPSWPIGAFAFSSGTEWAFEAGWLGSAEEVETWVGGSLAEGALRCDAAIFERAWSLAAKANAKVEMLELAEWVIAAQVSAERQLESVAQGGAFRRIAISANTATHPVETDQYRTALSQISDENLPYPVAAGALFRCFNIQVGQGLLAFLHAAASNLVSAAQRIVPLGHTEAQQILTRLADAVEAATLQAVKRHDHPIEDILTSSSLAADIACMRHETQYTRLFRT